MGDSEKYETSDISAMIVTLLQQIQVDVKKLENSIASNTSGVLSLKQSVDSFFQKNQ
jgi:hypothetical protein